ncbi:MAG: hypothetical protein RLY70_1977, partial [Planctomycetota bacterium]
MDVVFQSSCSSCPSWLLELSSVFKARSGECDCQLYRVLRAGRRTRCPSYMGRADVGLSRPAGRSWRPLCTTDILSVAAGGGIRHPVAIAVWRPGRRLRLGGKRGNRVQTRFDRRFRSSLYDGHLVRREHFERVASVRATLNNQGHRADGGRGNLCTTKHTKSTKVSENEEMDAIFQSSCSSCPSWLLELSSVVKARSGECDCQLDRVLRAGRRTRCPSY